MHYGSSIWDLHFWINLKDKGRYSKDKMESWKIAS